jgi:hypothetical protein
VKGLREPADTVPLSDRDGAPELALDLSEPDVMINKRLRALYAKYPGMWWELESDAKSGYVYSGSITPILGDRCRDRVLARLVDDNTGSAIKRDLEAVMLEVSRTFTALSKARAKFNRCSKPESREAARVAMVAAEADYRQVADRRDRLVELRNAQQTQRGGQPTISHDGPMVKL